MENDPKVLVSTDWLSSRLSDPEIRILDATWYLPNVDRDAKAEYDQSHIPNARFFDIDDVSDHRSDLPHMVPPVEKFMSKVRKLGVGDGHQIIIYDSHGLFSAARVRWLFKVMGQDNVAVLDGGLPKCGSGVTAAMINLALDRIGKTDHALYDGSWTEWGMYPTVPVETGDN